MNNNNSTTLLHRFLHWEATRPDAIYLNQPVADGFTEYSWREVGDQARRMAAYLKSLQLPVGSNIAILGKNTAHWIIADLAIWMAGHVSVPLYPTMSAESVDYVFDHAEVRLLFLGRMEVGSNIQEMLPSGVPVIALPLAPEGKYRQWEEVVANRQPLQDIELPAPEQLATIIYTSGTTGTPKGVMHSFGSMYAYASLGGGDFCQLGPDDRLLSYLPLAHAAERSSVESNSLCHGVQVFFNDSLETFSRDLCRARPSVFISMPRLWTKFYQAVNARMPAEQQALLFSQCEAGAALRKQVLVMLGLDCTRIAFTGSAPLPPEIVSWYRNLGLELLDVYGMSENFCYSHYSRPGQVRVGYVGQALPGVRCRISEEGEVLVDCPTRMTGYYRQPELTAESMTADGYFKTGDRGILDEEGRLKITGRVKELFKTSKGKYVAPAPIENKLGHRAVEAVCVTGPSQPQPFALLMLSPDGRSLAATPQGRAQLHGELEALLDSVNAGLESHQQLDYAVVVKDAWTIENGFLTPTLKIKRNVIESHYLAHAEAWLHAQQTIIFE
ncbi:AMP-binding protein [Pseudomonas resinovorans]|uniref:AMP-binding protein n=1 Tax=Metapseudomonas resinovorans TaxID=53412 RepID=A0ABT4Y3W2_METRE|nr:AMP-binding protein [Pseudomonas resinovorans]MDA8483414.1 AMP-binding protein [Pseudomonas resinovorans]